jgi:hypothetical protein
VKTSDTHDRSAAQSTHQATADGEHADALDWDQDVPSTEDVPAERQTIMHVCSMGPAAYCWHLLLLFRAALWLQQS